MAPNSCWRVFWASTDNGHGVTEGGSSGSPIFNQDGHIVGTLSGGSSYCDYPNYPDYYGKLSYHWLSNGAADNRRLKPWLDPTESGVTTLEGYDPYVENPENVIYEESFENEALPTGWSIETTISNYTWERTTQFVTTTNTVNPQHGTYFYYVMWQAGQDQNEWLISKSFDFTNVSNLAFKFYFVGHYSFSVDPYDNCDLTLKAKIGDGAWVDLWDEHDAGVWPTYEWNLVNLTNLTAYEGQNNVKFAFVYTGNDGAQFGVDNLSLIHISEPTRPY